MTDIKTSLPRIAAIGIAVSALGLAGCDDTGADPKLQIGANPLLPPLHQYLLPPIRIATPVEWGSQTPKVQRRRSSVPRI
jgi:hypothetical protein